MLPLTKALVPQMKMKVTFSAALIGRFASAASYSSTASLVEDKIWLMVPSHEAKDTPIGTKTSSKVHDNQQEEGKVRVHKWHDSCFYDIGKKGFITSSIQQQNHKSDDDQEVPKIVGSSHGYLALLKPSDCSLSLVKIPPRYNDEVHQLPDIDTLPPFTGKVFRESEFNHKYGEYNVAGFACRGYEDDEETIQTSKEVSDYFVEKIVMSSGDDLPTIMMTIHSPCTKMVFCQGFNAQKWHDLLLPYCCFSDVIYSTSDQKFYAIVNSCDLQIVVWDFKNPSPRFKHPFPRSRTLAPRLCRSELNKLESYITSKYKNRLRRYYLVESLGEILLVIRHFGFHVAEDGTCLDCIQDQKCELPYRTFDFDVFKLDRSGKRLHLVKSLGDQTLFLGINQSFAVSTKQDPGIEGNSIYFGDHYMLNHSHFRVHEEYDFGGHDFGIFNVEEKSFSACYPTESMKFEHPPVWIAPHLAN